MAAGGRPAACCVHAKLRPAPALCLPADSGLREDALSNNAQLRRIR